MAEQRPVLGKVIPDAEVVREIAAEWDEFVQTNAYRDEEGELLWGDALIRSLGETGLATLRFLAKRGHFESARVLKETFLGLPEQPLAVRVQAKTAAETEAMILEFLVDSMKLTPETAGKMLERFKRAALEMEPEPRPALPAGRQR